MLLYYQQDECKDADNSLDVEGLRQAIEVQKHSKRELDLQYKKLE